MRTNRSLAGILIVLLAASTALAQDRRSGVRQLGAVGNNWGPPFDVAVQGNYAYVATGGSGLRVVDISDPYHPREDGLLLFRDGEIPVVSVAVSGNYAFAGFSVPWPYFRVINITDPAQPREVGAYDSIYSALIAVQGDYAYVGDPSSNVLRVLDISDPENPFKVGDLDVDGGMRGLSVSDEYAYFAINRPGGWESQFRIADLSDRSRPAETARIRIGNRSVGDVTVSGDYAYVVGEAFWVIDVYDRMRPQLVSTFDFMPTGTVAVAGEFAYVTAGEAGLRVLDISDHQNIREVGYDDTPGTSYDVEVQGGLVYMTYDVYLGIFDPTEAIGTHFRYIRETSGNHSLLVTSANLGGDDPLPESDEIGVFTPDGLCCGGAVWNGEQVGFPAWMDDDQTEAIEGLRDGEEMSFRIWNIAAREEYPAIPEFEEGDAVFHDNGVSVFALNGRLVRDQALTLNEGWNIISAAVVPFTDDVIELMGPLVEEQNLIIMKDMIGRFYVPARDFNNIPAWVSSQGYQMKVNRAGSLTIGGDIIPADQPLDLRQNWQMICYYPRFPMNVRTAMATVVDDLILIKNNSGRFYYPSRDYDNIGDMEPGQGYWVKMAREAQLTYPADRRWGAPRNDCIALRPNHFTEPRITGSDMSLLVTGSAPAADDAELAAFTTTGLCVGVEVLDGEGAWGLAIRGDDPATIEIDGAREGEALVFKLWDGCSEYSVEPRWMEGNGLYTTNGFAILDISAEQLSPTEPTLYPPAPNPFNNVTAIAYTLTKAAYVSLKVFDSQGRQTALLQEGNVQAGWHSVTWDGTGVPSGVYICRLSVERLSASAKLILLR